MRRRILELYARILMHLTFLYTWLKSGDLKSCGKGVRFEYPLRLNNAGSISIGSETMFYPRVWLNAVSEWGGVQYDGKIIIGDRVKLGFGVQISAADSIIIEDDVAMSSGVVVVDHNHDHHILGVSIRDAPLSVPKPVRIGKGSFLGVYCLIGAGVQIGEHAVVAANAVVLKDVPSFCLAAGNPARIVRFHDPNAVTPVLEEINEVSVA